MKLCLVQHGHAVPKEEDSDRPLSETGRRDVERLAARLAGLGIRFSAILHSGKLRAQQTADIIASGLPDDVPVSAREGLAPNDPVGPFADAMRRSGTNTLIASHMPFVARLASLLLTGDENAGIASFEPGTALCLERDDEGGWSIQWILPPGITH